MLKYVSNVTETFLQFDITFGRSDKNICIGIIILYEYATVNNQKQL